MNWGGGVSSDEALAYFLYNLAEIRSALWILNASVAAVAVSILSGVFVYWRKK